MLPGIAFHNVDPKYIGLLKVSVDSQQNASNCVGV